ncbi:hypothetical protein TSOC_002963, partial [Tetrabaena socialis]
MDQRKVDELQRVGRQRLEEFKRHKAERQQGAAGSSHAAPTDALVTAAAAMAEQEGGTEGAGASSSAAPAAGGGGRRKILGKYGGAPALGAGLVLPRLQRDAILKATGSPAAREIRYSKVENKEASNLAEVMRFKVRKSEELGGIPALSLWQSELSAKKGRTALDGTDEKDLASAPSTQSHAVFGEELGAWRASNKVRVDKLRAAATSAWVTTQPQAGDDDIGYVDRFAKKFEEETAKAEGKGGGRLAAWVGEELASSLTHTFKALAMTLLGFALMWCLGMMPHQQTKALLCAAAAAGGTGGGTISGAGCAVRALSLRRRVGR